MSCVCLVCSRVLEPLHQFQFDQRWHDRWLDVVTHSFVSVFPSSKSSLSGSRTDSASVSVIFTCGLRTVCGGFVISNKSQ